MFILLAGLSLSSCVGVATIVSCTVDDPAEPKPTQKFGEIEFELNYTINGKSIVVSDTIVCSYEGRACDGRGLHNEWSRTFTSGEESLVLKRLSDQQVIYYPLGGCKQLMDGNLPKYNKGAAIKTQLATSTSWSDLGENELNEYGIQIERFQARRKP